MKHLFFPYIFFKLDALSCFYHLWFSPFAKLDLLPEIVLLVPPKTWTCMIACTCCQRKKRIKIELLFSLITYSSCYLRLLYIYKSFSLLSLSVNVIVNVKYVCIRCACCLVLCNCNLFLAYEVSIIHIPTTSCEVSSPILWGNTRKVDFCR